MARCEMKAIGQFLSVLAVDIDKSMRDVILVEEIVDVMSFAIVAARQHAKAGKYAVAIQPPAAHDQRIDDCLAHGGNFRQGAPECGGGNVKYFGLFRFHSGGTQDRCALE